MKPRSFVSRKSTPEIPVPSTEDRQLNQFLQNARERIGVLEQTSTASVSSAESGGADNTLTVSDIIDGSEEASGFFGALAGLNVQNLRILNKTPAETTFDSSDVRMQWDPVVPPGGQTLYDYRVRIIDTASGQVMRHRYVSVANVIYPLSENQADAIALGYDAPRRELTVQVIARSNEFNISAEPATKAISNPPPELPGDFSHTAYGSNLEIRFSRPDDGDYAKAEIFASTMNGFTPGPANRIYEGVETNPVIVGNQPTGTLYSRVLLYDAFGPGPISEQFTDVVPGDPVLDTTPPTVPTGLVLSSSVAATLLVTLATLTATWTPGSDDSGAMFSEIELWDTLEPTKRTVDRTPFGEYSVTPVIVGRQYAARVRSVDYSGNASDWSATVTWVVAGDTTPPANVTGASAVSGLEKIVVRWTLPTASDFLTTLLYRGTSAGFTADAGSLQVETRNNVYVDVQVVNGQAYYYKFATKDVSGNVSTASASIGPFTANFITAANISNYIANLALGAAQLADGAVVLGKLATNSVTTENLTVGDFTNLVDNFGFEEGDRGWTKQGNWQIANDPGNSRSGSWVGRVTVPSSQVRLINTQKTRISQEGEFYSLGYIRFAPGSTGSIRQELRFLSADGVTIALLVNGNTINESATTWTVSTCKVTAPAGAEFVQIAYRLVDLSAGAVYVDDAGLFRVAGSALIGNLAVLTANIADAAITNAKILDLDAAKITTGFLDAGRIAATSITVDKLSVSTLSSISANLGEVTAGTITGLLLRTASSGARVAIQSLSGVNGGVVGFNASEQQTFRVALNGSGFLGLSPGAIQWTLAGAVSIPGNLTISGTLQMTAGAIYGGKPTYASTTAGYWLGFDSGTPKFHIGTGSGTSGKYFQWDGSGVVVQGTIKTANASDRQLVLGDSDDLLKYNETSTGKRILTIGVETVTLPAPGKVLGSGPATAVFGSNDAALAEAQHVPLLVQGLGSLGLVARSQGSDGVSCGVYGRGVGHGVIGECDASTGSGVYGNGGESGVYGNGRYGGAFQGSTLNGGALLLIGGDTAAPTHTARSGTLSIAHISGTTRIYQQRAGGSGGTGSTWVVIGNAT